MSTPRLEPLAVEVDLTSRQLRLVYNVRWDVDGDDTFLATAARADLTAKDERWEALVDAIQGVVDDLSEQLGLQTGRASDELPLDDWGDPVEPEQEQEL